MQTFDASAVGSRGRLILILGPSGSGKGTVFEALRRHHPDYVFPVSCTTRDPRPGEKEGEVYHFISKEEFERRISAGDFLEYAIVHGQNYYGTLKEAILSPLREGKTVVREVDVQGLRSIRALVSAEQLRSIFLTVDGWETLRTRILRRAAMSEAELAQRHQSFLTEMQWADECDAVIVSLEGETQRLIEDVELAIASSFQQS